MDKMFPRALSGKILAKFDSSDLVFLLGTRRTGKTTLAHLLAKDSSYTTDETWYCDFEDKQYRQLFNTVTIASLKQILQLEGIDFNRRHLLIFDEIQLLDDPANLLKLLHDQDKYIIEYSSIIILDWLAIRGLSFIKKKQQLSRQCKALTFKF